MHITKMHGLGNDYIYLNGLEGAPEDLPGLAVRLSDRHFGVGGDGVICIRPGRGGDFTMEMYNADGSRGAMCGNGIRCVGKYVYDKGLTRKTCLTIDTDAGPRVLELQVRGGRVEQVTVDMGIPALSPRCPWRRRGRPIRSGRWMWATHTGWCSAPRRRRSLWSGWGPFWRGAGRSPSGSTWSSRRSGPGSGWRPGCGSGGAGSPWPAGRGPARCWRRRSGPGRCGRRAAVRLPGGVLELDWDRDSGHIWMTGPAVTVFEGEVD